MSGFRILKARQTKPKASPRFSFEKSADIELGEDLLHVGTYHTHDGAWPLVYIGRSAYLATPSGLEPIDRDSINPVVANEVAIRSRDLWDSQWPRCLSLATGIDERRLTGIRFQTSAIPPRCLIGLAAIVMFPERARAIAAIVQALGQMHEQGLTPSDWRASFNDAVAAFQWTRG